MNEFGREKFFNNKTIKITIIQKRASKALNTIKLAFT